VIVVNDGSPDTPALEVALQPFGDSIVYLKQENGGPSAARNFGIREASGEFVAFIDSDDAWSPEYLAEQMKLFAADPAPDLVCSDMITFGDAAVHPTTLTAKRGPEYESISLRDLLLLDYVLLPSSTVVRRNVLLSAGLFDLTIKGLEDWDLFMRIAHLGGRVTVHRKVLGRRRIHAGGLTRAAWEILNQEVRLLRKWKNTEGLSPEIRHIIEEKLVQVNAYIDLEEGKRLLKAGDSPRARAALQSAYAFFSRPDLHQRTMSTGPVTNSTIDRWLRRTKLRLMLAGLRLFPSFIARSVTRN
jgi:glycosyltransferase involved in cell wall biosynthesis